jgi:hypothetical protein
MILAVVDERADNWLSRVKSQNPGGQFSYFETLEMTDFSHVSFIRICHWPPASMILRAYNLYLKT